MTDPTPRYRHAAWLVMAAGALAFALTMGPRQALALFLGPINSATGLGLASISLAFAVGQLWWGLTQPFAGAVADRFGAGRVLTAGVALIALGMALMPFMTSTAGLIVANGLLAAGGAGIAGPSVLMAATVRLIPPERRGMATGVVNAGGSLGQFVFAPVAQALIVAAGWMSALWALAAMALLTLPAAWVLRGHGPQPAATAPREGTRAVLRRALADPSFRLLAAGFFVCGFHVAFLATHLPGVVDSCQLPPQVGAWALAVLGLFNIAGSLGMGWLIGLGRWQLKSMLSVLYAARGVAVLVFMLAPKTTTVMLVFAAVMGLTFLSTVPPTAGLVARFFGPANMGLLFGVVMLTHQIGGFLGAWLGGLSFQLSGHYDWMWMADIALAVAAALLHLPIREAPSPMPAVRPA